jgi:hypothetical protein
MAGTWTAAPLAPFSLNATPAGVFNAAALSSYGSASSGTSTIAIPTAWGTPSGANAVAVPNPSGNVMFWYGCGATAAGAVQVLVGEQVAGGQILPATTAMSITAASTGWIGPYSPAAYNIQNPANPPAGSVVTGNMPAAYAGCLVVEFTLCTTLVVAAFTFASIQP